MNAPDESQHAHDALASGSRWVALLLACWPLELIGLFVAGLTLFAGDSVSWSLLGTVFLGLSVYHLAVIVVVFRLSTVLRYWSLFRGLFVLTAFLPILVIVPLVWLNGSAVERLRKRGRSAGALARSLDFWLDD